MPELQLDCPGDLRLCEWARGAGRGGLRLCHRDQEGTREPADEAQLDWEDYETSDEEGDDGSDTKVGSEQGDKQAD